LNGNTGEVLRKSVTLAAPEMSGALGTFMQWVDEARTMAVLANADSVTPHTTPPYCASLHPPCFFYSSSNTLLLFRCIESVCFYF